MGGSYYEETYYCHTVNTSTNQSIRSQGQLYSQQAAFSYILAGQSSLTFWYFWYTEYLCLIILAYCTKGEVMSCFKEVHRSWISSWYHFSTLLLVSRQGHSLGGFMIQLLLIILTLNCSQQLTYVIKEDFKVKHLINPGLGCLTSTWWQWDCCFCESHWQTSNCSACF